jgi:hypothetical protein
MMTLHVLGCWLVCGSLALSVGCSGDSTSSASEGETSTSTTTGSTSAGETESTSTTDATTSTSSTSTSTSTTTGDVTTSTTTSDETTAGTTDGTTGASPEVCEDFCGRAVECGGEARPCLGECAEYVDVLSSIGPVCGAAIEAYLSCGAGLECLELAALFADEPNPCDGLAPAVSDDPPGCLLEEETPGFCTDWCAQAEKCQVADPECLLDCKVAYLFGNGQDPACGAAVEAYFSCLGALTCDELQNPVTCLDEATLVEQICDF